VLRRRPLEAYPKCKNQALAGKVAMITTNLNLSGKANDDPQKNCSGDGLYAGRLKFLMLVEFMSIF
jgi:hypothetical protein